MTKIEVPSDEAVVRALTAIGGRASALKLCEQLVTEGHPVRQSQLAIQRSAERGRITIERDWTVSVVREAVAA